MNAADRLSEIHMELKEKLVVEDSEKIRNWQKDAFHKQMIGGFRETKDADEGFRKAQKPWVRKLKDVSLLLCRIQSHLYGFHPLNNGKEFFLFFVLGFCFVLKWAAHPNDLI